MNQKITLNKKLLGIGALGISSLALSACGANSDSNGLLAGNRANDNGSVTTKAAGPLDPVQTAVFDELIGGNIAPALPAPVGPAVLCLSDGLNSLVDTPDALLASLTDIGIGADPVSSFQGTADDVVAALQGFAEQTQAALMMLAGQADSCDSADAGQSGNPLAGTPLEPVGDVLTQLTSALGDFSGDPDGEDPNLTSVTDVVGPLLEQLAGSINMIPDDARNAPVVGSLLTLMQTSLRDVADTLDQAGDYNAVGTQNEIENTLNNLLSGALLGVLPISQIEDATGQEISPQIQVGIDQLSAALGEGTGRLITPAFNDLLNGALAPVLDPVEGVLAQLLNPANLATLGSGGSNPLDGILGSIAGDGTGTPLDALLALLTAGAAGNPLEELTGLLGGDTTASPLDQLTALLGGGGLPLDQLLGLLSGNASDLPLLGDLSSLLGGLAI